MDLQDSMNMSDQTSIYGSPPGPDHDGSLEDTVLQSRPYFPIMMCNSLELVRRNMVKCSLCSNNLEASGQMVPLMLQCGHSVCLKCVRDTASASPRIICPDDKKTTGVCATDDNFGLVHNMALIKILEQTARLTGMERMPPDYKECDQDPEEIQRQREHESHQQTSPDATPATDTFSLPPPLQEPPNPSSGDSNESGGTPSDFFLPNDTGEFGSGSASLPVNLHCGHVNSLNVKQKVFYTVQESADTDEAREVLNQVHQERVKITAKYEQQKLQLQRDLEEAMATMHSEQDRQTEEIKQHEHHMLLTLQRTRDELNQWFSEKMRSVQCTSRDDAQKTPTDAGRDSVQERGESELPNHNIPTVTSLPLLQRREESIDRQQIMESQLTSKMLECIQRRSNESPAQPSELTKPEGPTAGGSQHDLKQQYQELVQQHQELENKYLRLVRQQNQSDVRYELKLSAKDGLILSQAMKNDQLNQRLQEQNEHVSQLLTRLAAETSENADSIPESERPFPYRAHADTDGCMCLQLDDGEDNNVSTEATDVGDMNDNTVADGDMTDSTNHVDEVKGGGAEVKGGGAERLLRQLSKLLRPNRVKRVNSKGETHPEQSPGRPDSSSRPTSESENSVKFTLASTIDIRNTAGHKVTGVVELWGTIAIVVENDPVLRFYSYGRRPNLVKSHTLNITHPSGMDIIRRTNTLVISDRGCLHLVTVSEAFQVDSVRVPLTINPVSVSVDKHSNITVTNGVQCVQVYTASGQPIHALPVSVKPADWVAAILVQNKFVLLDRCCKSADSSVVWFDGVGTEKQCYRSNSRDEMSNVSHMVERRGDFLIADTDNGRVQLISDTGTFVEHVLTASTDGILLPDRLHYDDTSGLLLVAQHDKIGTVKVMAFQEQRLGQPSPTRTNSQLAFF